MERESRGERRREARRTPELPSTSPFDQRDNSPLEGLRAQTAGVEAVAREVSGSQLRDRLEDLYSRTPDLAVEFERTHEAIEGEALARAAKAIAGHPDLTRAQRSWPELAPGSRKQALLQAWDVYLGAGVFEPRIEPVFEFYKKSPDCDAPGRTCTIEAGGYATRDGKLRINVDPSVLNAGGLREAILTLVHEHGHFLWHGVPQYREVLAQRSGALAESLSANARHGRYVSGRGYERQPLEQHARSRERYFEKLADEAGWRSDVGV